MTREYNDFEKLPFNEAVDIYIEHLIAARDGKLKAINKLFKKHPDLFQLETLKLAKSTLRIIAKRNNNKDLIDLLQP